MSANNKRIGFIDNNLDNFHANTYIKAIRGPLASRRFTISGCTARQSEAGRKWAKDNSVPYFDSIKKLNDQVDFFAILAPTNPEYHLPMCQQALSFGKPVFVDKTFAPSCNEALQIFELADQYGASVQTSSALRYTNIQKHVAKLSTEHQLRHIITYGSGSSFEEYGIHPVEMAVSCMGADAKQMMVRGDNNTVQILVDFSDQRSAIINVFIDKESDYAANIITTDKMEYISAQRENMFTCAAEAILDFFETGMAQVPRKQTLLVRRILDLAQDKKTRQGFMPIA